MKGKNSSNQLDKFGIVKKTKKKTKIFSFCTAKTLQNGWVDIKSDEQREWQDWSQIMAPLKFRKKETFWIIKIVLLHLYFNPNIDCV